MTDMIQRVATAIRSGLEASGFATVTANGPNGEEGLRQLFEVLAMDAIEAMREPTPAVLKGMWRRNDDNDAEEATLANWQDAIDAALGHPRSP